MTSMRNDIKNHYTLNMKVNAVEANEVLHAILVTLNMNILGIIIEIVLYLRDTMMVVTVHASHTITL